MTNAQPSPPKPAPAALQFGYLFIGRRRKDVVRLEGKFTVPSQKSAEDTILLVMLRDSRIDQGFLINPGTGEVIWGCIPGILRGELDRAGFGMEYLRGV